MVALRGVAVSRERDTPVCQTERVRAPFNRASVRGLGGAVVPRRARFLGPRSRKKKKKKRLGGSWRACWRENSNAISQKVVIDEFNQVKSPTHCQFIVDCS